MDPTSLSDLLGGPYAAYLAGQQIPLDRAKEQAGTNLTNQQTDEAYLKNILNAANLGTDTSQRQAQLGFTQAQTAHTQGLSDKIGLENLATTATQPGAIAATNAGNAANVSIDDLKQAHAQLSTVNDFATSLDGLSPLAQRAKMQEFAQQNPWAAQTPLWQRSASSINPGNMLSQGTKKAILNASDHLAEMDKQNSIQGADTSRAIALEKMHSGSAEHIAQMNIDAGKFNRNNRGVQDALQKALVSGNYVAVANYYDSELQKETNPEEKQYLSAKVQEYRQLALQKVTAGAQTANAVKPDVSQLGFQTNSPMAPAPAPIQRGQQQVAPQSKNWVYDPTTKQMVSQ